MIIALLTTTLLTRLLSLKPLSISLLFASLSCSRPKEYAAAQHELRETKRWQGASRGAKLDALDDPTPQLIVRLFPSKTSGVLVILASDTQLCS